MSDPPGSEPFQDRGFLLVAHSQHTQDQLHAGMEIRNQYRGQVLVEVYQASGTAFAVTGTSLFDLAVQYGRGLKSLLEKLLRVRGRIPLVDLLESLPELCQGYRIQVASTPIGGSCSPLRTPR